MRSSFAQFLHCMISYFLFLLASSCNDKGKASAVASAAVEVTDFIVEPKTIPIVFDFIGFAESSHQVEIRARVEGYLDKIAYEEGRIVRQGELLFQLDPQQYLAKKEQAIGELAKQQALLENAKLTVERLKPLYQQKAASKKDLDNAVANKLAIEASVQSAQAQLFEADLNLGYTSLRSPIVGMADRSKYREGALITPGINGLLTTVSSLDPIWVYFTVSESDILRIKQQGLLLPQESAYEVELILGDGSSFPHRGTVNFSAPTYDQSSGTILVRAVFPNPHGAAYPSDFLRPGEFVRVKVYGVSKERGLFVPLRALLQKKNGMFVYLIDKDNTIVAQDIATGEWYGDYQLITNGLEPGDRIVVDGINKVVPGMAVQVIRPWRPVSNAL